MHYEIPLNNHAVIYDPKSNKQIYQPCMDLQHAVSIAYEVSTHMGKNLMLEYNEQYAIIINPKSHIQN